MKSVRPSFYIVAETQVVELQTSLMLRDLGADDWKFPPDAESDADKVVELTGRLCYKSFGTELNPNITKTRDGNQPYVKNILDTKHGSVLEHPTVSVVFLNVSRILTHELVRHGDGTAFSQESMRFVRMDNIPMYIPDLTPEFTELGILMCRNNVKDGFSGSEVNSDNMAEWVEHMVRNYNTFLQDQAERAEEYTKGIGQMLDQAAAPFSVKKAITSAIRRGAPAGHATNIGMTANHRAWRWIFETRTKLDGKGNLTAEREIHELMLDVALEFKERYPAIYQDLEFVQNGGGIFTCVFANSKV